MFVVIPAYCPDKKLLEVVSGLLSYPDYRIVIVDDGSGSDYRSLFDELESSATVLRHEVNRGKGCAMKTAFEYIASVASPKDGVITVDADGQHLLPDIKKVISTWEANKEALVLGGRRFKGEVPFRSRFGNAVTRGVFAFSTGVRVFDTQTGLRAFSVMRIEDLLKIKGERYEYEINQLLYATKYNIPIVEIPIETVYINDNDSSHYRVIRDSWRIYKMILVFMLSSFSCFLIDYCCLLIFAAILNHFAHGDERLSLLGLYVDTHLIALVAARIISSFCNYILNRRVVFKSGSRTSILRYYLVTLILLAANYGLLTVLSAPGMLRLWIAQLVAQAVIYPCSFFLQRKFVFPNGKKGGKK